VKYDKPNNCYTYERLLEDLHKLPAEEVVIALRGKPVYLQSKTGWEEIFDNNTPTRFKSIKSFREGLNKLIMAGDLEKVKTIRDSPIILINPCKPLHLENMFRYNLLLCPKRPNKKNEERKE